MKKCVFLLFLASLVLIIFFTCVPLTEEPKSNPPPDFLPLPGILSVENVQAKTLTLKWTKANDDTTPSENLLYKAVSSDDATIDTLEKAAGAVMILDLTTDVYSVDVADLTEDLLYYFNIIVMDQKGHQSLYNNGLSIKTLAANDDIPPVPGDSGNITFSNKQLVSTELTWVKASDNQWPEKELSYKVVYSITDNINTIADAETNGILVKDWTADIDSALFNNPDPSVETIYYSNVIVKDKSGNKAIYTGFIIDYEKPTLTNSKITISNLLSNSLTLTWIKGIDNETSQVDLEYKIVESASNNINTVVSAELNGQEIVSWNKNYSTSNITNIPIGQLHYYTVLIRDEQNNINIYQTTYAMHDDFQDFNSDGWSTIRLEDWGVVPDVTTPDMKFFKSHVNDNELKCYAYIGESQWTDYTLISDFRFDREGGLIFHYLDQNNYYYLMVQNDKVMLYKIKDSIESLLNSIDNSDININTWYKLTAKIIGGNINCKIENNLLNQSLTYTDSVNPLTGGYAGLKNKGSDSFFDNISIQKE